MARDTATFSEIFGLGEIWNWLKNLKPKPIFTKERINFITLHYIYLIAWTILGSIMVYPAGHLRYIDALFLCSGSATQSGLNTVDINLLSTYQQMVFFIIPMFTNPIFINTAVVFVRLYWFERRFRNIVVDARLSRGLSRSRARTMDSTMADVEEGDTTANGRRMSVLHAIGETNGAATGIANGHTQPKDESAANLEEEPPVEKKTRDITFAQLPRPPRMPAEHSEDQHIAFLQKQRDTADTTALRIPGPRESDRGDKPHAVEEVEDEDEDDDEELDISQPLPPRRAKSMPVHEEEEEPKDGKETPLQRRMRSVLSFETPHPRRLVRDDHGSRPKPLGRIATLEKTVDGLRKRVVTTLSTNKNEEPTPYLSYNPTIGRNSAFVDLTEEQREELGGIEYRSLKTLAVILVLYFIGFSILGAIFLIPYIMLHPRWGSKVTEVGQGRVWWGIFTSQSSFNDLGYTLTPDSMFQFYDSTFILLISSFLIIIGNTGFPCMLRFLIWCFFRVARYGSKVSEELHFLLDHPRRCFTLMFPSKATWWLFWILVILNSLDLIFFIILDLKDPTVTSIPVGYRILDGWYQATATRTAGFAVVNLAELHPAIQVSYLVMMYISVFPIAISMRRTNVYEEKSLGIYTSSHDDEENPDTTNEPSYVSAHLRRQLSFDLWYIFLGLFIICIAEGARIENQSDSAFNTFTVLFEVVSAYGTVGLSLGYPGINASFSAEFSTVSKLVIIAMQLRGRHRGLPNSLDRAILLPSEALHEKEDQDAKRRVRRRSNASDMSQFTTSNPFRDARTMSRPNEASRLPVRKVDGEKAD